MEENPLYRWLDACGFFNKPLDSSEPEDTPQVPKSHLLLDGYKGGILRVPNSQMQIFNSKYAEALDRECVMYISEQRTPIYKFYYDLDIKFTVHGITEFAGTTQIKVTPEYMEDLLIKFVHRIYECIFRFFPETSASKDIFRYIVSKRDPEIVPLESNDEEFIYSVGAHVNFPYLLVNDQQALTMREASVYKMKDLFPESTLGLNAWEDIFDKAVYTGNGLRMIGSHKTQPCKKCKGKKDPLNKCPYCKNGKKELGRVYHPWRAFHGTEPALSLLNLVMGRIEKAVIFTSIRHVKDTPTDLWKSYPGCPQPVLHNPKAVQIIMDGEVTETFEENADQLKSVTNRIFLPPNSVKLNLVQEFIRTHMNPHYKQVHVHKISTTLKSNWFQILVNGEGSHYCQNYGRDHGGKQIYFFMTDKGICQKCFCRCLTEEKRKYGMCKDYKSDLVPITAEMKRVFFGAPSVNRVNRTAIQLETMAKLRNNTVKRADHYEHVRTVGFMIDNLANLILNHEATEARKKEKGKSYKKSGPPKKTGSRKSSNTATPEPVARKRKSNSNSTSPPKKKKKIVQIGLSQSTDPESE